MAEERKYTKKEILDVVCVAFEGFVDEMEKAMEKAAEKVLLGVEEGID